MAFDSRRTYLCYNNRDLIRDGFIPSFIEKEYLPVSSFNVRRLNNPPKGVNYIVGKDQETGEITSIRDRKKLLPASKIKIEIDFSKVMKNAVSNPFSPAALSFSPISSMVATPLLAPIGFGGITSGFTEITFQILETRKKINLSVAITQDIIDNGVLEFEEYPLSIFGIVKEHLEELSLDEVVAYKEEHPQARIGKDVDDNIVARIGLDFSNEQLDVLGKFSSGSWKGTRRKRIDGATDSDGLFGGRADSELKIVSTSGQSGLEEEREVVLLGEQEQLFVKIIEDDRKLKFRGDNFDAKGAGEYPFRIRGTSGIDATDKQIRIDTTSLIVGDTIYITYLSAIGDRYLRQNIEHKGTIGQGNTFGISGFVGAIGSDVDAFDYQIRKWKVPRFPVGISMSNIDEITENYSEDDDYKLKLDSFIAIDELQRNDPNFDLSLSASEIEGWRLSEAILWRRMRGGFFAADYRGILYYKNGGVTILYPSSEIRDQEWFVEYLKSLEFTFPSGPVDPNDPVDEDGNAKFSYLLTDLQKNIEDHIDLRNLPGFLFDTSEIVNSSLFDREKIHYYRPFANALKKVTKYINDDETTGIGIINLDLLPIICSSIETTKTTEIVKGKSVTHKNYNFSNFDVSSCGGSFNLEYYDLSYGVFDNTNAQPTKNFNCEEPFDIVNHHYFGTNYDAMNNGPGAWYDSGFIENDVFEWRPSGSSIESYWKLETPYYCDTFTKNSHVYIEKMGGNSLDNYSWIYIDTDPFISKNISSDASYNLRSLMISFKDEQMHNSLCYHKIENDFFESQLSMIKIDKTKTHVRDTYSNTVDGENVVEAYNHDKNIITGQNRILGDTPSYSYGIPITDEIFKLNNTEEDIISNFWWTSNLFTDTWEDGTSFNLNFSDSPPRANIPSNWYLYILEVKYSYVGADIKDIEKYISFYFEETESSVSNFKISDLITIGSDNVIRIKFNYYYGGPIQFLGEFWKKVNIIDVNAIFAAGNDETLNDNLNVDKYKIPSGQSAVVYDTMGRILVFYSNEQTSNIDVAISYDDGDSWIYNKNLIRLISGETASLPFVIKDDNNKKVHLFYVLNDAFLMYKKINTDWVVGDGIDALVEYDVPITYNAGDYPDTHDPERDYWGNYSEKGVMLRRQPSYFVAGLATDQYFIDQMQIINDISVFNNSLTDDDNLARKQTNRFLFEGDVNNMIDIFKGDPYAVYLSDDGFFRLFLISSGKLSIKKSSDSFSWQYDIFEQVIHKNYVSDELNKGFSEEISNIQIVRNDFDKSIVSVLYFNNSMLFIRHFQTNLLFPLYDIDGNLQNKQMINHLELTDEDFTINPTKNRTSHVPIFLVGIIPDQIKKDIISDIENEVPLGDSSLFIHFPYKDPDEPENKEKNKDMVNIFNENFRTDTDTQVYAETTAKGLIRVFYKDGFDNMNGIIIDSLTSPNLEVMNIFKEG